MKRVVVRRLARADIDRASVYYESERRGLGLEFLEAVDRAIGQIAANPYQYPAAHREMRRMLLHPFPYGLFYKPQGDLVRVYAVIHTSRHPPHWQRRA